MATVEIVSRQDKPPRKIYTVTEKDRQALQEWMDRPVAPGAPLEAFVMRLVLASNPLYASLITHLQLRHTQDAAHPLAITLTV